jgi:hypothetical protein
MANEGDEIALAAGFDTQNAEAVLGVMERDAVDQPGVRSSSPLMSAPSLG